MHADQRAAVEAVREKAGSKGVDLGIGWLREWSGIQTNWHDNRPTYSGYCYGIRDDAAALIVTGALAKWLAGQGWAVYQGEDGQWYRTYHGLMNQWLRGSTDHLSALLSATLVRLDELPDKEKA